MILLFLLTSLSCYVVYVLVRKFPDFYKRYQILEKIPGPPIDSLLLGHSAAVFVRIENTLVTAVNLFKSFGGIYRVWRAWRPIVVIADADFAEIYFTSKNLELKGDDYVLFQDWWGLGLITSGGPLWQRHRKLITPAFHFSTLNGFCDTFVEKAKQLVEQLREKPDGSTVDIYKLMYLLALDGICESTMGIKIDAMNNPKLDFIKAVEDAANILQERQFKPWYRSDLFYYTPLARKFKKDLETIFELSRKAIENGKEKADRLEKEGCQTVEDEVGVKKKLALLDLLLNASESTSGRISDQELIDEVNTFMFAGHDTTAGTMSYALYLLGAHPEIQERCYEELEDIFEGSNRETTVEDLKRMKYLEQVIKESLRLFPAAPVIFRKVLADTQFGKYVLPAGVNVILSIYTLHRDPKFFPDPEKFDPDRFSSENCATRHPFAYVPFAAGSRNCIGQKFAMMETKVVLSYILRNFTMESKDSRDELKISFSLVLRSLRNIDIKFKQRKFSN